MNFDTAYFKYIHLNKSNYVNGYLTNILRPFII